MKSAIFSFLILISFSVAAQDWALKFDGVDDHLVIDSSTFKVASATQLSVSFWLKVDTNAKNSYVFDFLDSAGYRTIGGIRFTGKLINQRLNIYMYQNGRKSSSASIKLIGYENSWNHIHAALKRRQQWADSAEIIIEAHLNGQLQDKKQFFMQASRSSQYIELRKNSRLIVGGRYNRDSADFFQGQLDELMIATKALDSLEMKDITCFLKEPNVPTLLRNRFDIGSGTLDPNEADSGTYVFLKNKVKWVDGVNTGFSIKPIADFSDSSYIYSYKAFFKNQSTVGKNYLWTFGDGTSSTEENPSHVFAEEDSFLVCLKVWNECGEPSDSYCRKIYVSCLKPTSDFTYFINGKRLVVEASDSIAENYTWYFDKGDTISGKQRIIGFNYMNFGVYQVCLESKNNCGSDTTCKKIAVVIAGMERMLGSTISVYPNPARNSVEIVSNEIEIEDLQLFSLTGEMLHENRNQKTVDTSTLSSGLYLLKITFKNGKSRLEKLIID